MAHLNIAKRKIDHILLIEILLISAFGMIMLYSASSMRSYHQTNGETNSLYFISHIKRLLLSIFAMVAFAFTDYRIFKKIAYFLIGISITLLALGLIIKFITGNTFPARWLNIGSFTFQTSDFCRLSLIIYLAAYLDSFQNKIKDFTDGLIQPIFILTVICGLISLQPDFSTSMVIAFIGFVVLFIGGAKISQLLACLSIGLVLSIPVLLLKPYRLERIYAWLNHEGSNTYQANQSLISLGNGGTFGLGLGNSIQKDQFLPTPHTDFIFAIIGEETGFLGCMLLLFLFLLVYKRGLKIARECIDPFGIFLSIGIVFNLICYTFVNVAVVTGIFPVTGLQIPMVSYGGSGLLINMIGVGILLNISQRKKSVLLYQKNTKML